MPNRVIELMDDMHLSSQATFMDYYTAMQNNNISSATNILKNNPSVANQIMNADNINILLNETYRRELIPKIDIDYFLEGLLSVYQKMIDFTKVMGEWDANTQYNVHNLVYYNEKAYYVYPNTTPPIGTPPTNTQYWREYDIKGFQGYGGINLNFKFNWDNTQNYKVGDVVIFQNKMWYAVADNTNYEPNLNHYPWVVISMPKLPAKTPIQRAIPSGYDIGDFWFQITQGDEVIVTTWGIRQPEPTPRFASSAFSIGTNIYIAGGIKSNFERTNAVEMFDTVLGTWSTKTEMPTVRARAAGFSIGNNGYCVGGIDEDGTILSVNEAYDSVTNSWSTKTAYPIPIISSAVSTEALGYIIGGETSNNVLTASSYSYNSTANTWTEITSKPTLTRGHTLATDGLTIYAIGGIDNNKNTLGINEAYTISSNTWSQKDTLAVPRSYLASFVQSGMIYAVGGLNSSWYSVDTNEKYDITNNEWVTDMPMNYKRSSLNALVSGTRGFAIGGIDFANSDIRGYNEQYNIDDIPSDFEMVINTTLDSTGSKQVTIPTPEGGNYDYWIDWGDGLTSTKITTYNDPQATHTYAEDGEYTIKLMGTLDRLKFTSNIANDLKSVTKCILNFSTITDMFNTCPNLENVCDGIFDQSLSITNANSVFAHCTKLTTVPLGLFDNNNLITEFVDTFNDCGIISIPVGLFDGNNLATNFSTTFFNCKGIASIPSGLFSNNTNVTNFYGIFADCTSLTTIPEGLFQYAQNTTNYDNAFQNCPITIIPNNCFNGSNASVENIFDVTKITSIGDNALKGLAIPSGFFQGATSLITIGNNIFDANVTNMNSMFQNCTALTTVGNMDFSNIVSNSNMFQSCTALTNLSGFKDRATNTMPTISRNFYVNDSPLLTHDSLINISDSLVTMTPSTTKTLWLHNTSLGRLSAEEKLDILNRYWTIVDYDPSSDLNEEVANELVQNIYGNVNTETQTHITTSLYYYVKLLSTTSGSVIDVYAVDKNTGIVYLADNVPEYEYIIYSGTSTTEGQTVYIPKGSDGDTTGTILKQNINTILTDNPTYKVIEIGSKNTGKLKTKNAGLEQLSNASNLFKDKSDLTRIYIYGTFTPSDMSSMLYNCSSLNDLGFESLDTSNVSNMSYLFANCPALLNFPNLNTSSCTNMAGMFSGCDQVTNWSFLNAWNTSSVTNMSYMFTDCLGMTVMPTFDMQNVIDASYMFAGCFGLTTITPNVIGNKVQNAEGMFQLCQSLDLKNIGDYTTIFGHNNNLTNVSYLFDKCFALTKVGVHNVFTLDESGDFPVEVIDETKVNNQLFTYCPNITNMSHIFDGCYNLGSEDNGIPMGIFYHCPNLQDISYAFSSCWNIQNPFSYGGLSLNEVLFVNNPELVNVSHLFENAHVGFIGENTANPTLLFPVQTKIEDASYLWNGCEMADAQGYELIPFIYTSKVLKNIEGMFMGQTFSRDISSNYDSYNPQYSWDNLQNIIPALENCSNLFSGNTNLTGNATAMIESLQKITTLTNHEKAFEGCTKLSDYNSIPTDWK